SSGRVVPQEGVVVGGGAAPAWWGGGGGRRGAPHGRAPLPWTRRRACPAAQDAARTARTPAAAAGGAAAHAGGAGGGDCAGGACKAGLCDGAALLFGTAFRFATGTCSPRPDQVLAGDLDADGLEDLIVIQEGLGGMDLGGIWVFRAHPSGAFRRPILFH